MRPCHKSSIPKIARATHTIILALRPGLAVTAPSNENKMSDGGRERSSLGVEVWKSSYERDAERSDVRSIAWFDVLLLRSLTMRPPLNVIHVRSGRNTVHSG